MTVLSDRTLARLLGQELRRVREQRGWTRQQLVERLPSGIGDRALLSYEHGIRFLTVVRFVEICVALDTSPDEVLKAALARSANLRNHSMRVHLPSLLRDEAEGFEAVRAWAERRLAEANDLLLVSPETVREMAAVLDVEHEELAGYLAGFAREE